MPCVFIDAACAASSRIASSPPCTFGCSVFTRPSIISGKPVGAETSRTVSPASASALAVPPVEISSIPWPSSALAKSTRPVLSDTDSRARVIGRSVMRSVVPGLAEGQSPESITTIPSMSAMCESTTVCGYGFRAPRFARPRNDGSSQRKLGFFARGAADRLGGLGVREGPVHARHLAGVAIDDDLHGAARPVGSGEIDALLQLHLLLVGVEDPHLAVRQHQHGAVTVVAAARLDQGMQVEAHRELILDAGGQARAARRHKRVFAIEPQPVGREPQRALMDDAVAIRIAVVGEP